MKNKFNLVVFASIVIVFVMAGFAPMQVKAANSADYSAVFDASYYYNAYPDLRQAIGNDRAALLEHFVKFGMAEGRSGNAEFNVRAYMENYSDLRQAFGPDDLRSYYLHYINFGKKEGRNAAYKNNIKQPAGVIASYSTEYDPSEDRAINIALAASKVNGVVVRPGERFSFSDTLGPRTSGNGYVMAPTFAGKKEVPGIGGGICQVSSTMYAAMLEGNIKATERYPHSLPVDYVPKGMDAAIAAGLKDLTFTNNFDFSIVINATADNGTVVVSFVRQ